MITSLIHLSSATSTAKSEENPHAVATHKQRQYTHCLVDSTISKMQIPNLPASSIPPSGIAQLLLFAQMEEASSLLDLQ
jgi:hypothetical protein